MTNPSEPEPAQFLTPPATNTTPSSNSPHTSDIETPANGSGGASSAMSALSAVAAAAASAVSIEPASVARRTHVKSRTGCRTCKRRKIKCDERRPNCANCTKHGVSCDYLRHAPTSTRDSQPPGNALTSYSASPNPPDSPSIPPPDSSLNLLDLELLHNFLTTTYTTLSSQAAGRDLWKSSVLRIAIGCDYVMRSVLAVSALHLAHYRPSRRSVYLPKAVEHHEIASRKAVALMADVNRENCESLWLFSILTLFYALGDPRRATSPSSLLLGESCFPDWVFLLGGCSNLVTLLLDGGYKGVLSAWFVHGGRRWNDVQTRQQVTPCLRDLQDRLAATVTDARLLDIYHRAIDELRAPLNYSLEDRRLPLDMTEAFAWKFRVANDFVPLLRVPTQEAVAIYAHFCVILKKMEEQWWLHGWATHIMSRAWELLDDTHRPWIAWPMEEMGWAPPM